MRKWSTETLPFYSPVTMVSSMDYRLQLQLQLPLHMADDDMLTCFGGLENNSLTYLINDLQNQTDKENNIFENIRQTSYVNDDNLEIALNMLPGDISILSLNCQSLTAKADSLNVLIENINKRCKLSAICLQETWLSSESDTSLFKLHGYNFVSVGKFCSAHSGLGIYISDDYNFKVMNMHEQSMLWDGMFVEISGQSLNDKKNNSWKYLSATEKHYRRL